MGSLNKDDKEKLKDFRDNFHMNPEFKEAAISILGFSKFDGHVGPLPPLPKEVAKRDDFLTQQMISTYRRHISPLVILSDNENPITE